jgi:lactoylglutathione lyase
LLQDSNKGIFLIILIITILRKAVRIALSTAHFDAFPKALAALKVPYSDWPGTPQKVNIRADGIKQVYFQDPDGNWIEVNSVAIQVK